MNHLPIPSQFEHDTFLWKATGNKKICLHNQTLDTLPEAFFQLPHLHKLEHLDLAKNHIKKIPSSLQRLPSLTHLDLSSNPISSLSEEIPPLQHLKVLFLFYCKIQSLSFSEGSFPQLETLHIVDNPLSSIPPGIQHLKNLRLLNLDHCQLTSIPPHIGNLPLLEELSLNDNQIEELPKEIGQLTQLKCLRAYKNALTNLPEEIGELSRLKLLLLSYNKIEVLPEEINQLSELESLDLSNNQLHTLPAQLSDLYNLGTLNIQYNPNLAHLPLSLGSLSQLRQISHFGTQISHEEHHRIICACFTRRKKQALPKLTATLEMWAHYASQLPPPSPQFPPSSLLFLTKSLTQEEKLSITEWLFRLAAAKDFRSQPQVLSSKVCQILSSLEPHSSFKKAFFSQVEENNRCCGDRAAMAFNELYTCWLIHQLEEKEAPPSASFFTLCGLAKTFRLRKLLSQLIQEHAPLDRESSEIYLYYETSLQESLGLVTAMENMLHKDIGKRKWIDKEILCEQVQQTYADELIHLPLFHKLLSKHAAYGEEKEQIEADAAERLLEQEGLTSQQLQEFCSKVQKEREQALLELTKKWQKHLLQLYSPPSFPPRP